MNQKIKKIAKDTGKMYARSLLFWAGMILILFNAFQPLAKAELTKDDLGDATGAFSLGIDLDALSYAVARHETGNCRIKTNFTVINNCHGIKVYDGTKLVPSPFPSYINGKYWATSDEYFKDLWQRKYAGEVTLDKARYYSGNDRAEIWYNNVKTFYAEAKKTNLNF
jgi:hypothetical protein